MQILVLEINTSITLFNLSDKNGSLKFENLGEIQDSNQLNYSDDTKCLIIDSTAPEEPKLSMLLTNFINFICFFSSSFDLWVVSSQIY